MASQNNHPEVVQLLVDAKANVNVQHKVSMVPWQMWDFSHKLEFTYCPTVSELPEFSSSIYHTDIAFAIERHVGIL